MVTKEELKKLSRQQIIKDTLVFYKALGKPPEFLHDIASRMEQLTEVEFENYCVKTQQMIPVWRKAIWDAMKSDWQLYS